MKPLLGVIGGMGTQATAWFYEKLHCLQTVSVEQEFLDVLLYSMPSAPDRTAYITGRSSESPLGSLIHAAKTLETAGADCIALPCATSHFFYADLVAAVNVPILNMLDETASYVSERGITKVCLFATDGTVKGRAFHSAFEKLGIEVVTPDDETQDSLMKIIYDVKRGVDVSPDTIDVITAKSLETGADAVILGCTELCVIASENPSAINILEVLAKASIDACKGI